MGKDLILYKDNKPVVNLGRSHLFDSDDEDISEVRETMLKSVLAFTKTDCNPATIHEAIDNLVADIENCFDSAQAIAMQNLLERIKEDDCEIRISV